MGATSGSRAESGLQNQEFGVWPSRLNAACFPGTLSSTDSSDHSSSYSAKESGKPEASLPVTAVFRLKLPCTLLSSSQSLLMISSTVFLI